ncbi:hypothetical protein QZH41_007017 [Actinostola sp. cb2023]|nr:hypothetical protein QZH41_007017 [Actinostola sp. cb2023]
MVENSLDNFKKEWKKIAASVKDEWRASQRKQANQKPGLSNYNADIVSPGSTGKVALEKNYGKITIHSIPTTRQHALCAILVNVCTNQENEVNQHLIHKPKSGINYLQFKVKDDRKYVRRVLKDKEISFYFQVERKGGQKIIQFFSLDLSLIRRRGLGPWRIWKVKRESLFPEYNQHKCCGCYSGCGPVAWAMILGFYDRLAHNSPSSGYSKRFWSCADGSANGCKAPKWMNSNVRKYILGIRKKLGTFCFFGGGATTPTGMKKNH